MLLPYAVTILLVLIQIINTHSWRRICLPTSRKHRQSNIFSSTSSSLANTNGNLLLNLKEDLHVEFESSNHHEVLRLIKRFTMNKHLSDDNNDGVKILNDCFNYVFNSCNYFVTINNTIAWYASKDILLNIYRQSNYNEILPRIKSMAIKIGIQQKQYQGLADINNILFPLNAVNLLPEVFALDNYLRVTSKSNPSMAINAYSKYIQTSSIHSLIPMGSSNVYILKSIALLLQRNTSMTSIQTLFQGTNLTTNTLVNIFDMSIQNNFVTIGCIVACIMALRDAKDFTGLYSVYAKSKILARDGKILDLKEEKSLPAIVYGQTVVSFAKLGAESLTYQAICDMLEAGRHPTEETLNNVFLELSKIGSHKIVIAILEQLQRFRISPSTMALNSMLNACEKAGDYSAAINIYETKIFPHQIDEKGVSVLIKCCDKINMPVKAVRILLQSIHANIYASMSLRERVFAILVNNRVPYLAIDLLLYLEQYYSNKGNIDDDLMTILLQNDEEYMLMESNNSMERDIDEIDSIQDMNLNLMKLISLDSPVTQSASIYAAVIACLASSKRPQESYEMLSSYITRGGKETSEMYVSVISAFKFTRNIKSADLVFSQLEYRAKKFASLPAVTERGQASLPPLQVNIAHFNALISVYANAKALSDHVVEFRSEIRKRQLVWDTHTYTSFIIGSSAIDVISLFLQLMDENLVPTNAALRVAFRAALAQVDGAFAINVVGYAWQHEVQLEAYDYILVFGTLRQGQFVDESIDLLKRLNERGETIPPLCYLTTLQLLERRGEWKKAITILLQMIRKGLVIESKAFNMVLSCCTKASEFALAISLYDQIIVLTKGKFVPNHSTYSLAIYASWKLRNGEKALSILSTMNAKDVPPSTATITQVIACLEACHQYEDCANVFKTFTGENSIQSIGPASSQIEIDLHGFSIHVAKAAILSALFAIRNLYDTNASTKEKDIIIITGIGKNSKEWLEPILKPAIIKWLSEVFDPPLQVNEIAKNPGRLLLPSSATNSWLLAGCRIYNESHTTRLSRRISEEN